MLLSLKFALIFSITALANTANKTHVLESKTTGLYLTIHESVRPSQVAHRTSKRNTLADIYLNINTDIPEKNTETRSLKLFVEPEDESFMQHLLNDIIANDSFVTDEENDGNNYEIKETSSIKPPSHVIKNIESYEQTTDVERSENTNNNTDDSDPNTENISEVVKEHSRKHQQNTNTGGVLLEAARNFANYNQNFKSDDELISRTKPEISEVLDNSGTVTDGDIHNIGANNNNNIDAKLNESNTNLIFRDAEANEIESLYKKPQIPDAEEDEELYDDNFDYTLTKPLHMSNKKRKIDKIQPNLPIFKNELLLEMLPPFVKPTSKEITTSAKFETSDKFSQYPLKVEYVHFRKRNSTSTSNDFVEPSMTSFEKEQNAQETKPILNKTIITKHDDHVRDITSTKQNHESTESPPFNSMVIETTTQSKYLVMTTDHYSEKRDVPKVVDKEKFHIEVSKDFTNLNRDFQDVSPFDMKIVDKKEAREISAYTSTPNTSHDKYKHNNNKINLREHFTSQYEVIPLLTTKVLGESKETINAKLSLNDDNLNNSKEKAVNDAKANNPNEDERWGTGDHLNFTHTIDSTNDNIAGILFEQTFRESELEKYHIHNHSVQELDLLPNAFDSKKLDLVNDASGNGTKLNNEESIDTQNIFTELKTLQTKNFINSIFNKTTFINGTNNSLIYLANETKNIDVDTNLKEVYKSISALNNPYDVKNFIDVVLKNILRKSYTLNESSIDNNHLKEGLINDTYENVLETILNKYLHINESEAVHNSVFNNTIENDSSTHKNISEKNYARYTNTTAKNLYNSSVIKENNQLNKKDAKRLLIITTPNHRDRSAKTVMKKIRNENNIPLERKEIKRINERKEQNKLINITVPNNFTTITFTPGTENGHGGITKGGILIRNMQNNITTKSENKKQYTKATEGRQNHIIDILNQSIAKLNLSEPLILSDISNNALTTQKTVNFSSPKRNANVTNTISNIAVVKNYHKNSTNAILDKFSIKQNVTLNKPDTTINSQVIKNYHYNRTKAIFNEFTKKLDGIPSKPNTNLTTKINNTVGKNDHNNRIKQLLHNFSIKLNGIPYKKKNKHVRNLIPHIGLTNNSKVPSNTCCKNKANNTKIHNCCHDKSNTTSDGVGDKRTSKDNTKAMNVLDVVIHNPFQVKITPKKTLRNKKTSDTKNLQSSVKKISLHPCLTKKDTLKKEQKEINNTDVFVNHKVTNVEKTDDQRSDKSISRNDVTLSNETSIILKALHNVTDLLVSIYDKLPENYGNKSSKTSFILEPHNRNHKYPENSTSANKASRRTTATDVTPSPLINSSKTSRQGQTTTAKDFSIIENDDFTIYKELQIFRLLQNLSDALVSIHETLRENNSKKSANHMSNASNAPNSASNAVEFGIDNISVKNGTPVTVKRTKTQDETSIDKDFEKSLEDLLSKSDIIKFLANKTDESTQKISTITANNRKSAENGEHKDNIGNSNPGHADNKGVDNFPKEASLNFDTIWSEQEVNHRNGDINVNSGNQRTDDARKLINNAEMVRKIINSGYAATHQDSLNYDQTFSNITGLEIVEDSTEPQKYLENTSTSNRFASELSRYLKNLAVPSIHELENKNDLGMTQNSTNSWYNIMLSKPKTSLRTFLNNLLLNNKDTNRHSNIQPYSFQSTTEIPVFWRNPENIIRKLLLNSTDHNNKSITTEYKKLNEKNENKDIEIALHRILLDTPMELKIRPKADMPQKDLQINSSSDKEYGTKVLECLRKGLLSTSNENYYPPRKSKQDKTATVEAVTATTAVSEDLTTTTKTTTARYAEIINDIVGELEIMKHRTDILEKLATHNRDTKSLATNQKGQEKTLDIKPEVLNTAKETPKHFKSKTKLLVTDRHKVSSAGPTKSLKSTDIERPNIHSITNDRENSNDNGEVDSIVAAATGIEPTADITFKPDNTFVPKAETAKFTHQGNNFLKPTITESEQAFAVENIPTTKTEYGMEHVEINLNSFQDTQILSQPITRIPKKERYVNSDLFTSDNLASPFEKVDSFNNIDVETKLKDVDEKEIFNKESNHCGVEIERHKADSIERYPWLGVIIYSKGKQSVVTAVILVTVDLVLASALDIDRFTSRGFRRWAKVILGRNCSGVRTGVINYNYHPEFREGYPNTLAVVQIDSKPILHRLMPICPPPLSISPGVRFIAIAMPSECKDYQIKLYNMQHVPMELCRQYYKRSGTSGQDVATPWPRYPACGRDVKSATCRWKGGTALALKQNQKWHLVGFGVPGFGCGAPSRYIDYGMYWPWVEDVKSNFGRPSVTRLGPNELVLRYAEHGMQRFGPCDPEERSRELFSDSSDLTLPDDVSTLLGKAQYNLTIFRYVDFTCIILHAYNLVGQADPPLMDMEPCPALDGVDNSHMSFCLTISYRTSIRYTIVAYGEPQSKQEQANRQTPNSKTAELFKNIPLNVASSNNGTPKESILSPDIKSRKYIMTKAHGKINKTRMINVSNIGEIDV